MNRPPLTPQLLLLIAIGGAIGSTARYAMAVFIPDHPWPLATWLTNVAGCGLFGVIVGLSITRFPGAQWLRPLLTTGFLGGFTTFSTFVFEAYHLPPVAATTLAISSVGFSLAACWGGYRLVTSQGSS